jgi:serine/threonine-protein kinase
MRSTTLGKYRIIGTLGRGATGTVYKAVDETLGREVAVKILNPSLVESETLERFRTEAAVLASLNHPGIATIYELSTSSNELLMVMELVRGETLEQLCDRLGPLPLDRAAYLIDQILLALEHAHRAGVVHRDLKPANVMLTEVGIKIMDFGVAHARRADRSHVEGYIVGTPAYMAPEQALGERVGEAADVYSIGVMFYRVLTRALPFEGETPLDMLQQQLSNTPTPIWRHRHDLPPWCDTIVQRALAKSPSDRFQTATEFRVALGRAAGYSVRRNSALSKLPRTSAPAAASRDFRTLGRKVRFSTGRESRVESSLVAFAAGVTALACMPLLHAKPTHTEPVVTTPPPIVFDTKVIVPGGVEHDAQLTLSDCKLEVTTEAVHPVHLVPYGSVISTAYSLGRQPLWSSAKGPAPVAKTLRPSDRSTRRHWLVVRTNMDARYVVMRFEQSQIAPLLSALEDRTGRAPKVYGIKKTKALTGQ